MNMRLPENRFSHVKPTTGRMSRTVTKQECHWLRADIPEGTQVFLCTSATYGCVDFENGEAICLKEDGPFSQVPKDSVKWDEEV